LDAGLAGAAGLVAAGLLSGGFVSLMSAITERVTLADESYKMKAK
jgi:hypothetical protein